jgi:cytochrome c oxidase subunit 3
MLRLFRILTEKPWLQSPQTPEGLTFEESQISGSPQKTALLFFIGVVTAVFTLFITAYFIRMELEDWRPMPEASLLWTNTFVLFLASVALQLTYNSLRNGRNDLVKGGLLAGAVLSAAFIYGQMVVWQQMNGQGFLINTNPANAFFYLLTGIHALHLLGGLWVWARATLRVWTGTNPEQVRLSVELCALYWHFLLLVWLIVFALLSYT